MASEAKRRAQKKYQETHRDMWKFYSMRFNKETDADVIQKLEEVENIQGYIKKLIRADK